jgi:galactokinase
MKDPELLNRLSGHEIVVRAPGRINLIGEHTDYNQGLCMPAAIDRCLWLGASPAPGWSFRSLDQGNSWDAQDSEAPDWAPYFAGVIRLAREMQLPLEPLSLDFGGDLPSGAGLSSSSAICCGLSYLLNRMFGWQLDTLALTRFAVRAESHNGLLGGMMDQISILSGKESKALLIDCHDWSFRYLDTGLPDHRWLIADTRVKHRLVDSDYNARSLACRAILTRLQDRGSEVRYLGQVGIQDARSLAEKLPEEWKPLLLYQAEENERVRDFATALEAKDVEKLGLLLLRGHAGLRDQYRVSCPELDLMVEFAANHPNAAGARMMGGGFGGSTLHLVQRDALDSYGRELAKAYRAHFGRDPEVFEAQVSDGVAALTTGF